MDKYIKIFFEKTEKGEDVSFHANNINKMEILGALRHFENLLLQSMHDDHSKNLITKCSDKK